jgi:putative hemolysin
MYIPWDELEKTFSSTTKKLSLKFIWDQWTLLRAQKTLQTFRPKIRPFIERDAYIIKTVESSWELAAALQLRHEVFYDELLNNPLPDRVDIDRFDLSCDHLIIVNKKSNLIVGTYRLNSTAYSHDFYSASEFDISGLLAFPGQKVELGRACIHKDYRNGLIITLLWRGIQQYSQLAEARYLFGCSSIQTTDLYAVTQISAYLRKNQHIVDELDLFPQRAYQIPDFSTFSARYENQDPLAMEKARKAIPPLLLSYLKAGARVGHEPAIDQHFRCVDFMTILETGKLADTYSKKFAKC